MKKIKQIAVNEGFIVKKLPSEYQQFFLKTDFRKKTPHLRAVRCVDDRSSINSQKNYDLDPQIPGCWYGLVDAYKNFTYASEEKAQLTVAVVLNRLGFAPTTHGHCGYLGIVANEDNESVLQVETQSQQQREKQVKQRGKNGIKLELVGEHFPRAIAIINLQKNQAFNTRGTVVANKPGFNFDYLFSQMVEQQLVKDGYQNLQNQFADQVLRLYLRTIKKLTRSRTTPPAVYLH